MKCDYLKFKEKTIQRIEEITLTDYQIIDCKIQVEKCIDVIEDLINEYDSLLEEYNDFKTYVEDNYSFKEMR